MCNGVMLIFSDLSAYGVSYVANYRSRERGGGGGGEGSGVVLIRKL